MPKNSPRRTSKGLLAISYIEKMPNSTNTAIAKALAKDYPNDFATVEHARSTIRVVKGQSGDLHREKSYTDVQQKLKQLKKDLPKGESERIEPYVLPKSCTRILILSDIHFCYQDDDALFAALQYGIDKDVNCVYLNGDTIDMYQLSRHEKNPANRSFSYELDVVRTFLRGLREMFPNAHLVYKLGNHCFARETEVLTPNGFIDFADLKEDDLVGQFDKDMNISFVKPTSIIKQHYNGFMYHVENNYSRQFVTDGHRVAVGDDFILAKDLKISDVKNIPLNGFVNNQDYDISDDMLRFIVWLVCDGCIVFQKLTKTNKIRFQFKLSKERKINALKELLEGMDVPYTFKECKKTGINKLQPYYIRLYHKEFVHSLYKELDGKKQFPSWFRKLSKRQVEIVLNEVCITDGSLHDGGITLTTTSKHDASLLQEISILNGINCNVVKFENQSGFDNGKLQYKLRIKIDSENSMISVKKIETLEYEDTVYCVEMPLGTVITRNNGKVAFSGNCARYEKYIMQNAPHLLGIDALKLSELLNFTELRIHEVKSMQWAYAGKLPILHGHELPTKSGGVNPARTVQLKLNKQGIVGHFHRETRSNGKQFDDKPYTTYSSGALCDLNPAYMPINDWTHGFTYVEVDPKTGNYYVQQKTIVDGKIY